MRQAIICWLILLPLATAAKPLEMQDIFEVEWASDVQISPDARDIVYVRNFMDIMNDRRVGHLWRVSADGGKHRPLVSHLGSVSQPRWSPDGQRLAFVASGAAGREIHIRWEDDGQVAAVTRLSGSPGGVTWSPDGRWLAFSMLVPEERRSPVTMPKRPEGAQWAPGAIYIDDLQYRADGAGYLTPGHSHLFVVPADGGTPRQVTSGNFQHRQRPAWTHDSSALIFSANRNDDRELNPANSELYRVDIASGEISQLTDREGPDQSPAVSPDGRKLAYVGFDDKLLGYHNRRLYVANIDGSERAALSAELDRSVGAPVWSEDGRSLYVAYDDKGDRAVARIGLNGDVDVLTRSLGGNSLGRPYTSGSFSVARGTLAITQASTTALADVSVIRRDKSRQLTRLNDDLLKHREVQTIEPLAVKSSHDQRDVGAWMIKPPGFDPDKQYPLILEIHGGPFSAYGPHFALETQLYAAAGYIVVYANPRGSTSYGDDFANQIHHAYPSNDYDDLMSVVDAALAQGFVDADRMFVTGGSGGGVLTAWIVGKTDRFARAVVQKPVINWTSFALTADSYNFFYRYWFPAPPWEAPEQYWARSPLSLVGNVTTPTMLLTGEADYRTPIGESEQYYQALKLRGIETALVRLPEASHGIANRPSQLAAKVAFILEWFSRGEAAKPNGSTKP